MLFLKLSVWKCIQHEGRCCRLIFGGCSADEPFWIMLYSWWQKSTFNDNSFMWFYSLVDNNVSLLKDENHFWTLDFWTSEALRFRKREDIDSRSINHIIEVPPNEHGSWIFTSSSTWKLIIHSKYVNDFLHSQNRNFIPCVCSLELKSFFWPSQER